MLSSVQCMEDEVDAIVLPDAPPIPGLTFRPFRGESDYPGMVAVHEASKEVDRSRSLGIPVPVRSIAMFVGMGMEETALGVDTQNPNGALRLYESVGYQVERRYTTYRKPLT
jgi:hypothetical protein